MKKRENSWGRKKRLINFLPFFLQDEKRRLAQDIPRFVLKLCLGENFALKFTLIAEKS